MFTQNFIKQSVVVRELSC